MDFNEGKGDIWVYLIMSMDQSMVSRGPFFSREKILIINNYPRGVVMLLIMTRGNSGLIKDSPGG